MATARQKTRLVGELGLFMLEEGKILTGNEYRALGAVPLRWATMRRLFGNWNRALAFMAQMQPDIWKELQGLTEPKKVEPKKVEPKKVEPKKVEPKKVEPKKVEPKKVEPKKVEPKKVEPKKVEEKSDG